MILGLDLGIAATGWCLLDASGGFHTAGEIKPTFKSAEHSDAAPRIAEIVDQVGRKLTAPKDGDNRVVMIGIEGYAFSRAFAGESKITVQAELAGALKHRIWNWTFAGPVHRIPFVSVASNTARSLVLGKMDPKTPKKERKKKIMDFVSRYYGLDLDTDNIADAFVVARATYLLVQWLKGEATFDQETTKKLKALAERVVTRGESDDD